MQNQRSFLSNCICTLLLVVLGAGAVFGQNNTYAFKTLTSDQGLIHNHINCSVRDRFNYLWFGTESGLSRFDGVQFTNFRYSATKGSGLSSNVISGIFEGPQGNIWIRTGNRMNLYDQRSGRIIQHLDSVLTAMKLPTGDVYTIRALDNQNFAVLYADRSLLIYDATNRTYRQVSSQDKAHSICDVISGKGGTFWVIHEDGFIRLMDTRSLQQYKIARLPISSKQVNINLFEDKDGDLWIFSKDIPIAVYWLRRNSWIINHLKSELSNPFVGNIRQDNTDLIWLGTDHGGINVVSKETGKVQVIGNDKYDLRSLPYNSITSLYKDKSGIIWVGTYKGGISYYHPNLLLFPLIRNYPGLPRSLPFDDVNKFVQDHQGNLWIGTNGGGLLYYDVVNKNFLQYKHDPNNSNSLSSNVIVSLHVDRDNVLWIGTYRGGMCRFDGKNFKTFQRSTGRDKLNDDSVWEIYEDSFGRFWVGTLSNGLYVFDKKNETFSKNVNRRGEQINGNYISVLFEDTKHQLWIGTATGLARLSANGEIAYLNTTTSTGRLNNDLIYDIKEDQAGRIWVATQV